MRLRNDGGYPLEIRRYGRTVWPGEQIDASELVDADGPYDPAKHGPITGITLLDELAPEPAPKPKPAKTAKAASGEETSS
jgi:hypothetical protein